MRCYPRPAAASGAISRSGASALYVSDGPISSNSGRNGGKNAGRNYVSALPQRAMPGSDFPRILAGKAFCRRCRIKGLCLRSPARRLARPLAPATVGVFPPTATPLRPSPRGVRVAEWHASVSLPLDGFAPLNDAPLKPSPWGEGGAQRRMRCPSSPVPPAGERSLPLEGFAPLNAAPLKPSP